MSSSTEPPATVGLLPRALTGLAGIACAACCAIPLLLGAGLLGRAGWAAAGQALPGIAVMLAVAAAAAWRWTSRHRHDRGGGGGECGRGTPADRSTQEAPVAFEG